MKKILLSLLSIGAVAVVAVAATGAFFSDTETSTGNTFTAGELDLKVDNECHYWTWTGEFDISQDPLYVDQGCDPDGEGPIVTDWTLSDLVPGVHKFFDFDDIKPGDFGEDTVSLHVFDNDAWGRLVIDRIVDSDVDCTEPESESTDLDCNPTPAPGDGELRENLSFWVWLDQGRTPGFQCPDDQPACPSDLEEGDNVWQEEGGFEPPLITPGTIDLGGETHNIWEGLALAALVYGVDDGVNFNGLYTDGHMEGSTTYYFGIGWELPNTVGNEVQSDTFGAYMTFEVEQYRNNPVPFDGL